MKSSKASKFLVYFFLILGSLIMIFPFLWMLLTSFKTVPESMSIPATIFPSAFRRIYVYAVRFPTGCKTYDTEQKRCKKEPHLSHSYQSPSRSSSQQNFPDLSLKTMTSLPLDQHSLPAVPVIIYPAFFFFSISFSILKSNL